MTNQPNPFGELRQLFEQMQTNFEEMARSWDEDALDLAPTVSSSVDVDLRDTEDELVLTAELPGFDKDDIDVQVTDRTLRLAADQQEDTETETAGDYVRRERRRMSVARSIQLPAAVETDATEATYNNGILTVRMPKSDPASEGTDIEIN